MLLQNNGGCEALNQRESYPGRKEGRRLFHKAGIPFWADSQKNFLLVLLFSFMDGLVLYSIFDECLTQSVLMGIVMAFGVAVVLNIMPLIIARYTHAALENTAKQAKLILLIFIIGFFLIYFGTVYLRFAYRDSYGQEDQSKALENTVSNEKEDWTEEDTTSDSKGIAVVILLSVSPLITSLLGFGIAFVSDDEIKQKVEWLEINQIEIEEKISDTEAALKQMKLRMETSIQSDLDLDEQSMEAAMVEILSRCNILKALSRQYLAQYLANPSATTRLSQEMVVKENETVPDVHEWTGDDKVTKLDPIGQSA